MCPYRGRFHCTRAARGPFGSELKAKRVVSPSPSDIVMSLGATESTALSRNIPPNDGYEYLGVVELGNDFEFYIIVQSLAVFPRSKSIAQDIRSRFS